jgi:hypothetical protein
MNNSKLKPEMTLFSLKWEDTDQEFPNVFLIYADCTKEQMSKFVQEMREEIPTRVLYYTDVEMLLEILVNNEIEYVEAIDTKFVELSFEDGTELNPRPFTDEQI